MYSATVGELIDNLKSFPRDMVLGFGREPHVWKLYTEKAGPKTPEMLRVVAEDNNSRAKNRYVRAIVKYNGAENCDEIASLTKNPGSITMKSLASICYALGEKIKVGDKSYVIGEIMEDYPKLTKELADELIVDGKASKKVLEVFK